MLLTVVQFLGIACFLQAGYCVSCPIIEHGASQKHSYMDEPRLTSKQGLEARLRHVMEPLEHQLQDRSRRSPSRQKLHRTTQVAASVERVPQEAGEMEREEFMHETTTAHGEKRLSAYLPSDYLFWFRSGECPQREEGVSEFFCPSPDRHSNLWSCVSDHQLCDQMRDCPNGEDETPSLCLFYHVMQSHVTKLTQSLVMSARERGF